MLMANFMRDYGPNHPDYPNPPKDWNEEGVILRDGSVVEIVEIWEHSDKRKDDDVFPLSQRDVIMYPTTNISESVCLHRSEILV